MVMYRNNAKVFTAKQVNSGELTAWIAQATATTPCPVINNPIVTQTATQTATTAATQAASAAATAAASSAASNSANSAASSAASGAATAAATPPPTPAPTVSSSPPPSSSEPPPASGGSSGTGTSSSSTSTSSSSSGGETKTETKPESKSESKTESKSESKSDDKKDENKSDSKKDEKKSDDKKDEKKKEDKKKEETPNPLLVASDLTTGQTADGKLTEIITVGVSQSSLAGDRSYGATGMLWSTLDQAAVSISYTKMNMQQGKLNSISSYSSTMAYLKGVVMTMGGYTWVKPHPKFGVSGVSVGVIGLFMPYRQNTTIADSADIAKWFADRGAYKVPYSATDTIHIDRTTYTSSVATSLVVFWMHPPITISPRTTVTPQLFLMGSPMSYSSESGLTTNKTVSAMVGTGLDYKLTKRFGISSAYRAMIAPGQKILSFLMIGSRITL